MRKNFNKQYNKRPWKTPSPSSNNDIKSPRYNANRPPLLYLQSKTLKQDIQKNKPMLLTFKNQLVELKQQANKIAPAPAISLDALVHREYMDDGDEYKNNDEIDSYNSYFTRVSSVYSNLVKNSQTNNKNTKFVRGSGFKTEDQEPTTPTNQDHKHEQKMKKYVDHISKMKENYKKLEDNYEKNYEYTKKIQNQLQASKSQIAVLKKKLEQKKYRQGTLNQQIKNLKQLLEINTNQLNISNFEIYKMKQQIYELTLEKQKMEQRSHPEKLKPTRSEIKNQYDQAPCLMCKTNQKLIISLNNAIENKMLEVSKKDTTIQSLCADLQKMEIQSKMFDKPKFFVRKVGSILQSANQLLVVSKLKELNNKYKKQAS